MFDSTMVAVVDSIATTANNIVTSPTVSWTATASLIGSIAYMFIPDKRITSALKVVGILVDFLSLNWKRFKKDKKK